MKTTAITRSVVGWSSLRMLYFVKKVTFFALLSVLMAQGQGRAQSPTSEPPSAIGNRFVSWLAVSPAYERTGLIVAVGTEVRDCIKNCTRLWVTRDGGASWKQSKAAGWEGGQPVIAVDDKGAEALFSPGNSGLQRSDDASETWDSVGASGIPTPMPSYPKDGAVAVAGGKDYVLRGSAVQEVGGSGGVVVDLGFAFASTFPDEGRYAPALLVGADKSSSHPIIQTCTPDLSCSGAARLEGPTEFAVPVSLHLSTGYSEDGVIFAQSRRGVHKSSDGGHTFLPLKVGDPTATDSATPMLALARGYKEAGPIRTIYVALVQIYQPEVAHIDDPPRAWGGVYRSTDGGVTWTRAGSPSPLDGGASAVALAPDGRLFAGYMPGTVGQPGLLCSVNGRAWRPTCPPVGASVRGRNGAGDVTSGDSAEDGSPQGDARSGNLFDEVSKRIAATAGAATEFPWSIVALGILGCIVAAFLLLRSRRRSIKSR